MNILVVDDNPTNRLLLRYMIHKNGNTITEAADGEEAVNLAKNNKYDIIFMDMMMPVMNGYQATKIIKETIDDTVPIYIISAYCETDFPTEWKKINYDGILSKPIDLNTIITIINKHINGTSSK
jgi:CheY-like chemotaxis protein